MPSLQKGRVPLGPGGEFDLIRRLLGAETPLPPGVLMGAGDDCAVLAGGMVVSADQAVEDIHFRRDWITLREAGFRSVAGALSDLAAMAAEPLGVLLAMALPKSLAAGEAPELQDGASEASGLEGVQILGGDLVASPGPIMLTVVVLGRSDSPVLRRGTREGDELWVTGRLGGSRAAVALWSQGSLPPKELRQAFARPRPRIQEALWLKARTPIHGLIDLSDGLAGDAGHLAAASGVGIVLEETSLPADPAIPDGLGDPLPFALEGGEDFELCLTVPPGTLDEWTGPFQDSFGIPLTKVGWAMEGKGLFLKGRDGTVRPLERLGFSHFRAEEDG